MSPVPPQVEHRPPGRPRREIEDRLAIRDVLEAYAFGLDERDFAAVQGAFTDDAALDYTALGGWSGTPAEVIPRIEETLKTFPVCQHHLTNCRIRVSGDTATANTYLWNPLAMEGGANMLFVGARYDDELVRTDDGWRISRRTLVSSNATPVGG